MPVMAFPSKTSWGYSLTNPFAVEPSYGGSDGFKRLVDAAHGAPLLVASTETGVAPYACTQGGVDHPKDVPASDVAIHCTGGREDATVWYDPTTFVPDKMEIPGERATLIRRP